MKRAIVLFSLVILILASGILAGELVKLKPKIFRASDLNRLEEPINPWTDDLYALTHCDGVAEYYLGSGAADDTFFIVFEPLAVCSVYTVEAQWYTAGNVISFVADYSEAARIEFANGRAPGRGLTDTSPIGDMMTGLLPNAVTATGDWEFLDTDIPFVIGDPVTFERDMFGVGFIKGAVEPHPLADNVSARGINYTYTWFGGPWTLPPAYPHVWGAYSGNPSISAIEVNIQCWVSYWEGMPILISDLTSLSDTYDNTGPFDVTVNLVDDNGITVDDTIELVYMVNGGDETRVDLVDIAPIGDDVYGAAINISASNGDLVEYWVETIDDATLVNNAPDPYSSFMVVAPVRPASDVLFVDEGMDEGELAGWVELLDNNGTLPEWWNVPEHGGIDASVTEYHWNNIIVSGWGCGTVPALDDDNAYSGFLSDGGNMMFMDQDYFYANGLPVSGTFAPGDFAYDYFGLVDYFNDPAEADTVFYGATGDPVTGAFAETGYVINLQAAADLWTDYMTTMGDEIFRGEDFDFINGVKYEDGMKTIYLSFQAYWGMTIDTAGVYHPSTQFTTLIEDALGWFGAVKVEEFTGTSPTVFSLCQNYPNPFNPSTSISFSLGTNEVVTLRVFNMMGQEVMTLANGRMNAGPHMIEFDASNLTSGVYYYKLDAGDFNETKTMLLLK